MSLQSAAGLCAIYLPLAVLLHRPVAAPRGAVVIRLTPIQLSRFCGFAYEAPLREFGRLEEYSGPNLVPSPILVYEDDKPLGPSVHDENWADRKHWRRPIFSLESHGHDFLRDRQFRSPEKRQKILGVLP